MNFQHIPDELALKLLLHQFVDAGLHGRFTEAFDLLDASYVGIGMGEQGVVHSKEEALLVLRDGFRPVEGTVITYDVQDVNISWLDKDAAIIFCRVIVTSTPADGQPMHSELMQTIGARRSNGCWCIAFTHASPVLLSVESVEAYPVRFLDGTLSELRTSLLSQQQPHCDVLTGVLNREGLQLRAAELQRESNLNHSTALFMLDLDDFKQINDRLGHQTGDSVLQKVAQTLRSTFRDGDAVGRIGGDEFMVLISGDLSVKFLEKKADELLEAMRLEVTDGEQIAVSVSIGIAYGQACTAFEKLYLIADTALYTAKRAGKARYYLINSDTNTQHSSGGRGANLLSLQTLLKRADGKEPPVGTPYEALAENIPGGIIMFELSYSGSIHITMCNKWFSRLVGYSSSEFFAMQAENPFVLVHPDELSMVTRAVQSMIDGADCGNLIYRVRHKDGSYSYIKQVISVTERSHGSMTVFGALTDVNEIMQARNCREQADNQASKKNEELQSAEQDELTGLLEFVPIG